MPRDTHQSDANRETHTDKAKSDNNSADDVVKAAHEQADEDIKQDADLSIHSPNDDLDEGETARLGEDRTDLV
jgi:hypothetical protein